MTSKAEKLFHRMQNSKTNWKRADLDSLYLGFGFIIRSGGRHDIATHPEFPMLRATLPRHSELANGYVEFAVKTIKRLKEIQEHQNES